MTNDTVRAIRKLAYQKTPCTAASSQHECIHPSSRPSPTDVSLRHGMALSPSHSLRRPMPMHHLPTDQHTSHNPLQYSTTGTFGLTSNLYCRNIYCPLNAEVCPRAPPTPLRTSYANCTPTHINRSAHSWPSSSTFLPPSTLACVQQFTSTTRSPTPTHHRQCPYVPTALTRPTTLLLS